MARKETYRSKNIHKLSPENSPILDKPRFTIDPEVQQAFLEGKVILIDKPLHWTSFDMIRKLRSLLRIKKIGHAGTLDPLATGLLIICTGKFTKKINEYMAAEKEYTGSFTLGAVTPTYDLESDPEQFKDYSFVTPELLQQTIKKFIGNIQQLPPIYSAIKKDGEALYQLARRGEEVALQPRPVTIKEFEITNIALPVVDFRVVCSTGTYIRSLANDVGASVACGAYLSKLCRTRIGDFDLKDGVSLEKFEETLKVS
ncbi:tRNA pseudouridine(55) synthase TruB [Ferruginibacter albus]|uniref:tRNA pseudouridine(55) synthase TruB n=1 Tax=Ferruginibacter albus TaxID=2875540 RepID=UPI001CC3FBDB|nr:tRNA pseudouridine(55) synthase TruB [Ferruginibacter albus]UAY53287.1 tRNA pseudouridine(55) synthase TruB [Ferruginibacter albus]